MPTTNEWGRINSLPGVNGTFGLLGGKWGNNGIGNAPPNPVTWNFAALPDRLFIAPHVNLSSALPMTETPYRDAFERAIEAWADAADVRLTQVSDSSYADISMFWRPLDGNGRTLAQTWLDEYDVNQDPTISPSTRTFIEFDTADYSRSASASQLANTDFYAVAVHELGHALGLEHVNDRSQVMYPYLIEQDGELGDGDLAGIHILYGPAPGTDARADVGSDSGETFNYSANSASIKLWGLGGQDILRSGAGADALYGGAGNDTLESGAGNDSLRDSFGNDRHVAGAGSDVIRDFAGQNTIDGGEDGDVIVGGYGADRAIGGAGNDALLSDWYASNFLFGNDVLDGGAGNDRMMGGLGQDVFVFRPNEGNDTIGRLSLGSNDVVTSLSGADFLIGSDRLDVRAFGFGNAGEALDALRGSGGDTIFELSGTRVVIRDVDVADFTADEFLWV